MKGHTAPSLFPYQSDALRALELSHRNHQRILLSLPTGTGKTMIGASYAKLHFLDRGQSVCWIAHNEELLDQAFETFERLGLSSRKMCRLYAQKDRLHDKPSATIHFINNLVQEGPDEPGLLVVDEAHHAAAKTYLEWLSLYRTYRSDGARVLGLTATPYRLHEGQITSLLDFGYSRPKVPVFERIAFSKSFCDLATIGRVAPFRHVCVETHLSFKMKEQNGDFTGESLEQLDTNERNRLIFEVWSRERAKYGKTLIFVGRQDHARRLARLFGSDGDYAVSDDDKGERRDAIDRFRRGDISVLVNVRLFSEGVDVPDIRTVILARPTLSPILFMQMIGRGSRVLADKRFFYLVDIHDQLGKYESLLASVSDLANRDPRLLEVVTRRARASEKLAASPMSSITQDAGVLLDFLVLPERDFAGWVVFENESGESVPSGALLTQAEYDELRPHALNDGRLAPRVARALRKSSSPSIARCRRLLLDGCWGRLHAFGDASKAELAEAKKQAAIAFDLEKPRVLADAQDFGSRLRRHGAEWGVPDAIVGRCLGEYVSNRDSYAAAVKVHDSKGSLLRLLSAEALQVLKDAFRQKVAGRLDLSAGLEIQRRLASCEPDLASVGGPVLEEVIRANALEDFCVLAAGG